MPWLFMDDLDLEALRDQCLRISAFFFITIDTRVVCMEATRLPREPGVEEAPSRPTRQGQWWGTRRRRGVRSKSRRTTREIKIPNRGSLSCHPPLPETTYLQKYLLNTLAVKMSDPYTVSARPRHTTFVRMRLHCLARSYAIITTHMCAYMCTPHAPPLYHGLQGQHSSTYLYTLVPESLIGYALLINTERSAHAGQAQEPTKGLNQILLYTCVY